MGYFGRHWRGELSLPVSFWINNGLLMLPLGFALGLLLVWAELWGQSLQATSTALLVGTVVLSIVSVWAPVGVWRSARVYRDEGGSPGWALAARGLAGLGVLGSVFSLVVDVLPQLPAQLRLAAGQDPIGRLEIQLSADRRSVRLSGPFGMGAAGRFQRTLNSAPELRRVVLESPGGRLFEAHEIATAVHERGLQTRAIGDCASACTLVFVAGSQRSLAPTARLGFHRASVPSSNPLHDQLANRTLASLYGDAGLPRYFIDQVLRTPSWSIWFPAVDALVAAGILPPPTLLPELDATLAPDAPAAAYREVLSSNLLWTALEERQAGAIDDGAARMQAARQRGLDAEAAAREAQAAALDAVPVVLRSAGMSALDRFLAALSAELRERRPAGDASCQAVLGAATATASASPPQRLADWMQGALLEPADPQAVRPLTALELEVLRRELGPDAPERITAMLPGAGPRRGAPGCARAIELLDAMAALKAPQRRLAARLMLSAPG